LQFKRSSSFSKRGWGTITPITQILLQENKSQAQENFKSLKKLKKLKILFLKKFENLGNWGNYSPTSFWI